MSSALKSSCVVKEFPLPEREYRVSPRHSGRSVPRTRRHRRLPALPLILLAALLLFGSGFLLGLSAAAQEGSVPPAPAQMSAGNGQTPPETPANGVYYLGMASADTVTPDTGASMLDAGASMPDAGASMPDAGTSVPDKDAWNLLLVNGSHPLAEEFAVPERTDLGGGHSIDSRVYPHLRQMLEDARAAGYQPLICSSFRTQETQERLFANKVRRLREQGYGAEEAEREAAVWVARPGTSEHQAALAVDIVDVEYQMLDQSQEDRPVQKWLMENCAEYGFILRYPSAKSDLTGVGYEPWHYRYVGEEAAKAIMEQGICLEEYLTYSQLS